MATTQISGLGNLVVNAYDTYVRAALRSLPVMRSVADLRPVSMTNPGTTLKFAVYSNLTAATTALTETSDVTPVALGNPSQVTVTVTEYGNAVEQTEKVNLAAFSDIDTMIGDAIAYNAASSITNIFGFVSRALAIPIRWRWPPLNLPPSSPIFVLLTFPVESMYSFSCAF